jgi:hypothetical protein
MSEKKEDMGVVTHFNSVDDDTRKHGDVKQTNVASVALGKT